MKKLTDLEIRKVLESGKYKEFYSDTSDIVREYVGIRYQVNALDNTTSELSDSMKKNRKGVRHVEEIEAFLRECDLVKFAGMDPSEMEGESSLRSAMDIIENCGRDFPKQIKGESTGDEDR